MIDNITDKLHKFETSKAWTIFEYVASICLMLVLAVLIFSVFFLAFSPLCASANGLFPYSLTLTNSANIPFDSFAVIGNGVYAEELGNYTFDTYILDTDDQPQLYTIADGYITVDGESIDLSYNGIPDGNYYAVCSFLVTNSNGSAVIAPIDFDVSTDVCAYGNYSINGVDTVALFIPLTINTNSNYLFYDFTDTSAIDDSLTFMLVPAENSAPPTDCPTLEEQIAQYSGSWVQFINMVRQNNPTLGNSYQHVVNEAIVAGKISVQGDFINFSGTYYELLQLLMTTSNSNPNIQAVLDKELQRQLEIGYQNGFSSALSGNGVEDPIDQYWNSTKDYILIAGQPYFMPNGFGSIDPYNTIGIYGEHESKLHKLDGSTQTFNGQYVTEFASTGTLGGGWYKLGATVGDEYAYEQTLTTTVGDKAYYVARVSPLGDPVEEFLVAIWVDGYEAWFVAEEYVHYGTVANNNKSYNQVYSIYMTDISPTSQRFVNYDNPILYETFNEDINATLYLATFNQLNNYNVYTDGIGIVEAYNNGYDTGANTTLWLNLISQPIVAFFSIPLAQVIIEGVTYTLTYGVVLGAGIVALIVIWFLKLFAGG